MFREVKKNSLSAQIAQQLRIKILNGEIKPGTKLPSEKELATLFGTNRNTLREGIRILEEEGLISVKQGGGMMVLDWKRHGGIALLPHMLTLVEDPKLRFEVFIDTLSMRRMALSMVARTAAENASERDISLLEQAIENAKKAVKGNYDPSKADLEFYDAMVDATKSLVLRWVTNTIFSITNKIAQDAPMLWIVNDEYIKGLEGIKEAIKNKDPQEAQDRVQAHLYKTDEIIINILKGGLDVKV